MEIERSCGLSGGLTGYRCDVDAAVCRMADGSDCQVAQSSEHTWQGSGPGLGSVLVEGHVPHPVQTFDGAVSPHHVRADSSYSL